MKVLIVKQHREGVRAGTDNPLQYKKPHHNDGVGLQDTSDKKGAGARQ